LKLLAVIVLLITIVNCDAIVEAQQQADPKQLIGYAENEINNFNYNAQMYWFNVSQTIMHDSFVDIVNARTSIGLANSFLTSNESIAFTFAAEAAFAAKRANYRLFLNMTQQLIEDANYTFYAIPTYIPKPESADATLRKAIQQYQSANMGPYVLGYYPSPSSTWDTLNQMEYATRHLWSDDTSAANLAKQARQEVLAYLAQQMPVYRKQIQAELLSVKSSLDIGWGISLLLGAVSSIAAIWIMKRQGKLRRTLRSDRIVGPHIAGGFFAAAAISLPVAGGSLWLGISNLYAKSEFYELSFADPSLLWIPRLAFAASFAPFIIVLLNAVGYSRWRYVTALGFLVMTCFSIITLVLGWWSAGLVFSRLGV
jgi:hypothetical protein